MRESSRAPLAEPTASNVIAFVSERDQSHDAFERLVDDTLVRIQLGTFLADARKLARGLVALGMQQADRIAIWSPTRYEWALCEFAIWYAGGVVVPIYDTSADEQVTTTLLDAGVTALFCADDEQRRRAQHLVPGVRCWTMDASEADLAALATAGDGASDNELFSRLAEIGPSDDATIVYTSGTSGTQRGARITHGNLVRLVANVAAAYQEVVHDQANTVLALPLAHILARGLQLAAIAGGMRLLHVSEPQRVVSTLSMARPTFMVVVPRLLQKIRLAARRKAADRGLRRIFAWAERTAVEWGEWRQSAQHNTAVQPPVGLRLRHKLFDKLFYARLRALLGGRMAHMLSGAAPLDRDLCLFFWGIGVPIIEGYGLTETTAPATGNLPGDIIAGSVGVPIPGTTIRIAEDGEVLIRGYGVFAGYLTGDQHMIDGFFPTGDLGELDDDGRLWLHGRKKNVLVTASGKNVTPEPWEEAVAADPLVAYALLAGDGRPYLVGLLILDLDECLAWADRHRLAHLRDELTTGGGIVTIRDATLLSRLGHTVQKANAPRSRPERAKAFSAIVCDLESGALTPTLKLRREYILAACAAELSALYGD